MLRRVAPILFATALTACGRKAPADAVQPLEPPIERARLAAPRQVASSTAFDLVPTTDGAMLIYGRPSRLGGGIAVARLGVWGEPVGGDTVVWAPELPAMGVGSERIAEDALEVEAELARGSVAIAFVARTQLRFWAKSLVGMVDGLRFGAPTMLGETVRTRAATRGTVGVAATEDGRFHATVRLEDVPCTDGSAGPCARVAHAELRGAEVVPSPVELRVPSPCVPTLGGPGFVGRRMHYTVCSTRTGAPVHTAYTLELEQAVASSSDVLQGCSGVSLVERPDEMLFVAACEGGRHGVRQPSSATAPRPLPLDRLAVRCEGRTAVLETSAEGGATIRLDQPLDRLEALLPPSMVPEGGRAVFTGKAVIVAQPLGSEVTLHRFDCDQGQFQSTDHF